MTDGLWNVDPNGPFAGIDIMQMLDETLPPDHIKWLHGNDQATVFRLDAESETAEPVATWPEKQSPPRRR